MSAKKIVLQDRMELYKIVARVNTIGLNATAESLECSPSTLSRWLASQGYTVSRVWSLTNAEKKEVAEGELDYWVGAEVAEQMRQEAALGIGALK